MADVGDTLRLLAEHGPALRAAGFAHVALPDGTSFTLTPAAPAPLPVDAAGVSPSDLDDADEELDGEALELATAQANWGKFWERMTRSSGAPIPPFPGIELYRATSRGLGVA